MARRVHVVPHTHWDREWYLPFQDFRLALVDVLDDLLGRMETDPSYTQFLLDGQLAVLDDYLAVRPEAAEPIRRLVGSGRLSIGPWYTLPDEFLVSGETLVRNLQLGWRVASRFGGAMAVGYLPDMFGHVAQMPQILKQMGFDQAVVWRGTPSAVDRTGFWWRAPDASTVRTEYLPEGYGNGAHLSDDARGLVDQIGEFDERWAKLLGEAPILWMNGSDHKAPNPHLGPVIAAANDLQDRYELVVSSLPEHLAQAPVDDLPSWDGELRSGARANLLMGVTSNRVDVRQAVARAERALERMAEPLSALLLPAERWPDALLDEAWLNLVRNAAHDSVCACSVDEVCDAVLHRYAEATQIAEGLTRQALRHLSSRAGWGGPLVVNPSARPRGGLVELVLPGEASAPPGTQLVATTPAEQVVLDGPVALVGPAAEELGWDPDIAAFTLETEAGNELVSATRTQDGALVTSAVRTALAEVAHPGDVRLRVRQRPSVRVLAHVPDVPGFGWRPCTDQMLPDGAAVEVVLDGAADGTTPEARGQIAMSNDLVRVAADPATGTWMMNSHAGLGRLVDGGDCGDTYNWCPPTEDTLIDSPESVDIEVLESGPLRARLLIRARYAWPERFEPLGSPHAADAGRRSGELRHNVETHLELRAGEAFVRVTTSVDNRSRDHRLRAHFPLPSPATSSQAECAFAVVDRPLHAEGGPTEQGLATYPARRFVQAGGLTIVHDGVAEYELVGLRERAGGGPEATELALTLLRANGMLSQGPMTTRPLPAGPLIPLEGPQLQKRVTATYAVAVGDVDPYALADDVLVPLKVTQGPTGPRAPEPTHTSGNGASGNEDPLPATGSALAVLGGEVSAVVRTAGGLQVRVINPTDETATIRLPGRQGWLVDLRDRPQEPFDESFDLRPWGIATLALKD